MFAYRHKDGCGGLAFLYSEMPKENAVMESAKALHLDGTSVDYCSEVTCDTCGKPVIYPLRSNLEEYTGN